MRKLHTSVVEAAFQAGYPLYRIPGIVATETGALLVGYEARNTLASRGMGDWAVIDLYVRRSVDGGRTWQPRVKLLDGLGKNTTNNPVFIVDGGRIHFIGMENYKRAFHRVSDDDGEQPEVGGEEQSDPGPPHRYDGFGKRRNPVCDGHPASLT